jgi:hypothetical protein
MTHDQRMRMENNRIKAKKLLMIKEKIQLKRIDAKKLKATLKQERLAIKRKDYCDENNDKKMEQICLQALEEEEKIKVSKKNPLEIPEVT